jgi:hypothetical protein
VKKQWQHLQTLPNRRQCSCQTLGRQICSVRAPVIAPHSNTDLSATQSLARPQRCPRGMLKTSF